MFEEPTIRAEVSVISTEENFDYWLNQDFISETLKDELRSANLLIVPQRGFRDRAELTFPVRTHEMYDFLKENETSDLAVDICIDDKDYKELALHSELINLADVVLRDIVLPLYLSLLANYLYSIWGRKTSDKNIKMTINVVRKKTAIKIKYEGPAEGFKNTILNEVKKIEAADE